MAPGSRSAGVRVTSGANLAVGGVARAVNREQRDPEQLPDERVTTPASALRPAFHAIGKEAATRHAAISIRLRT
ncbi:hypothetical protein SAMN05421833_1187 [Microbispora rosea]|uniref:Uncharacterized protein n=1 Tax=Microbispora rosea TaxID=58117 RepID=A0A1N7EHB0_9ACTN|nr:hypothetical protein Mro03_50990 [Microbispora rosea subsp. rosea]SIR87542.1 hypothetical protein SAMN05421833_1187 [Microbispora rosea]